MIIVYVVDALVAFAGVILGMAIVKAVLCLECFNPVRLKRSHAQMVERSGVQASERQDSLMPPRLDGRQ